MDRFRKTFIQALQDEIYTRFTLEVPGCEGRTAERIRQIVTDAVDKLSRQNKLAPTQVAQLEYTAGRLKIASAETDLVTDVLKLI